MQIKRAIVALFIMCFFYSTSHGQSTDSLITSTDTLPQNTASLAESLKHVNENRHFVKSLILPATLTAYGFFALNNDELKSWDSQIKNEVWTEHPHRVLHFDDGLQYIPGLSVFILQGLNVPEKNTLVDATRQYLISSFLMMVVVQSCKKITSLQRPDGNGHNTFPSGHTSTAFVAAEFLNQEYKDRSPWYSIAGYTMATVVGYMRIYNNRHWFKDVVSGAGIGIGITKFVYWIYPTLKKHWFNNKPSSNTIVPYFQNGSGGLSLVHTFQ